MIKIKNNNNFYSIIMDQYNSPIYPDSSRNYSRQQTPFTNQYVYDDVSDHLRVSSPFSQDFYQQNVG